VESLCREAFGLGFSFRVKLVRLLDFTTFNNLRLCASLDAALSPFQKRNEMIVLWM
jgi:hypothetical protein